MLYICGNISTNVQIMHLWEFTKSDTHISLTAYLSRVFFIFIVTIKQTFIITKQFDWAQNFAMLLW